MKIFQGVLLILSLALLAASLHLENAFMGLMIQVAVYGLAVVFLSRWMAALLVLIATGYVLFVAGPDPIFVLSSLVWVLVFAWVLLDGRGSYALRGLLVVPLAAVVRVVFSLVFHYAGLGVTGQLFNPFMELVALIAGGYAGVFAAAYMGPRLKQWLAK
jgi:hypothetical protein